MGKLRDFIGEIEKASELNCGEFLLFDTEDSGVDAVAPEFAELHSEAIDLLYDDFNGQSEKGIQLFGEFRFLSLRRAEKFWEEQCDINLEFELECSDKRLKDGFGWRKKWFPFAWSQDRIILLITDYDPSPEGDVGQVFALPADCVPGWFVAPSITEFLNERLEQMSAHGYELDRGELPYVFPV